MTLNTPIFWLLTPGRSGLCGQAPWAAASSARLLRDGFRPRLKRQASSGRVVEREAERSRRPGMASAHFNCYRQRSSVMEARLNALLLGGFGVRRRAALVELFHREAQRSTEIETLGERRLLRS